jgi:hypothetical protein
MREDQMENQIEKWMAYPNLDRVNISVLEGF